MCASACVFRHEERQIAVSVHGDDFTASGPKPFLDWYVSEMQKLYELTIGGRLGPGDDDDKEATILNRVVRWTSTGVEYEADPRQAERFISDVQLDGANGVVTPGVKPLVQQIESDTPLPAGGVTPFRGHAARSNYLSADRIDILFSAKEVCRFMSSPTAMSTGALKRIVRYLRAKPRLVWKYDYQDATHLEVYSDTDWA